MLRKWEKMVEGFGDARARFFPGNISALLFELLDDLEDGVGRAGEVVAELALEHGQVVEVIARNEGGGGI